MPPNNQYYNNQPMMPSNAGIHTPLSPKKSNQNKFMFIALILVVFLILSIVFGVWSYDQMKTYKNDSDRKSAVAVEQASIIQKSQLESQFASQEKLPLKTYISPSDLGSINISYPKTWSAYIIETTNANSGTPVDGYFYPNFVPDTSVNTTNYYLRVQIISDTYQDVLANYQSQIQQGETTAKPFTPSLVKNAAVGVELSGQLDNNKNGEMVILPIRSEVLKIWTEDNNGISDFNNDVLANLSYSP